MVWIALKMLTGDRSKYIAIVIGITFSVVLMGEQAAMFFLDPSGNAIEFKAFKDPSKLFSK